MFILFGSELTLFCLDLSLSFAVSSVYFAVSFVVVPCVRSFGFAVTYVCFVMS